MMNSVRNNVVNFLKNRDKIFELHAGTVSTAVFTEKRFWGIFVKRYPFIIKYSNGYCVCLKEMARIHIIDSPIYNSSEILKARKRTQK